MGYYAKMQEARIVNKKLGRLLNPGMKLYFYVMAGFCLATLLLGQFLLAVAEGIVILLLFCSYLIFRKSRHRNRRSGYLCR